MKRLMKTIILFLVLVCEAFADPFTNPTSNPSDPFAAKPKKIEMKKLEEAKESIFYVSKTNASDASKAQFLQLWEALQNPTFTPESIKLSLKISQSAEKEGDFMRYITDDFSVLAKRDDLVDGNYVSGWFNPDGIWEYTTVLKAKRRVKQYKEAVPTPNPDAPTKEQFVEKLKAGETFSVFILANNKCQSCFGKGKLGSLQGGERCGDCGGSGSLEKQETWILKW